MKNTMNKFSGTTRLAALASFALAAASAQAALIVTNGDFEGSEFSNTSDNGLLRLQDIASTGDGWYTSSVGQPWIQTTDGGPDGADDAYGQKVISNNHRGGVNIITDNGLTTGLVTMSVDVLFSGTDDFLIKVWGVNDSDGVEAGIQWDGTFDLNGPNGNTDGLDLRNNGQSTTAAVSYAGSDISELLSTNASSLGLNNSASWQTDIQFSFDLGGTGYDQIVVGFGFHDSTALSGVDNLVVVPEPGTYALLAGCFALTAAMVRRRQR